MDIISIEQTEAVVVEVLLLVSSRLSSEFIIPSERPMNFEGLFVSVLYVCIKTNG